MKPLLAVPVKPGDSYIDAQSQAYINNPTSADCSNYSQTSYSNTLQTSSNTSSQPKLAKYLNIIWPIYKHEAPKVFAIMILMFAILFIQNIIRGLKDTIINTQIATETIPFLKFGGVLPASVLAVLIYIKLVDILSPVRIFWSIIISFLIIFGIFGFVIFPNQELLHLSPHTASVLGQNYPHFKWLILLLSNWSYSLFYIIAELWPTIVYSLLYWQFVNSICSVEESKRFYLILGLLGQAGLPMAGLFLENVPYWSNYITHTYYSNIQPEVFIVKLSLALVILLGIVALASFWTLTNKIGAGNTKILDLKVKKKSLSFRESISIVFSSRYITLIALMLICYGATINLIEGPWKAKATKLYPNMQEYSVFVGTYLKYNGIVVLLLVILGSNIVRVLGWFVGAIISPIVMLITGMGFFLIVNFEETFHRLKSILMFTDPLVLAVNIGMIQNMFSKSTKYTVFDATKEMAYVPLENEIKTKGKAAADLIGGKLGKSIASLLQVVVFTAFPTASYSSISMLLMIVFGVLCIVWLWCIHQLNKEYTTLINTK